MIGMLKFTLPPYFPICVGCDLLRRECSVLLRMPLRCDLGKLDGQIILSSEHFSTGTYWASTTIQHSGVYRSLPAMSFLTNPHTLRRLPKETLYGVQFTFFVGCHCAAISRKLCCQIIFLRNHHTIGTNRTSAAHNPRFNRRFPLVSTLAHPPNRFMTARKHCCGVISLRVGCHSRANSGYRLCKSFSPATGIFPAQYRTTCSVSGTRTDRSLPCMPLLTTPPHFSLATIGYKIGVSMEDCAVCPIAQAADFVRSLRKTLSAFFSPNPSYITKSIFCHNCCILHRCFVT